MWNLERKASVKSDVGKKVQNTFVYRNSSESVSSRTGCLNTLSQYLKLRFWPFIKMKYPIDIFLMLGGHAWSPVQIGDIEHFT